MRAFIAIGVAVATFWAAAFFMLARGYAETAEGTPCRDEKLLLSVNTDLGNVRTVQSEGRDLTVYVFHQSWMGLDAKRKRAIAMAAWCVKAQEKTDGVVLVKSGNDVIGRIDDGIWTSDFGS